MLATYDRRGNTNVPGTVSLIRDLADAVRTGVDLEAIVRDLAAKNPWEGDVFPGCRYCDALQPAHESDCDWWTATQWVIAHDPAVERNGHE